MELFKNNILAAATFFGVSGGVLGLVNFIAARMMGLNPFPAPTDFPWVISCLLLITSIIAAIYYFRKVLNGDTLHFWQGLFIGFCVWIIFMLVECIGIFTYLTLDPEYLATYLQKLTDELVKNKAFYLKTYKEADFDIFVKQIEHTSVSQMVLDGFIKKSIPAPFVIFITSLVMRRQLRDANGNLL